MYKYKYGRSLFSFVLVFILIAASMINPVLAFSQDNENVISEVVSESDTSGLLDGNGADDGLTGGQANSLPATPSNITVLSSLNEIGVVWDEVYEATGYDIEVDGDIIGNLISASYTHTSLEENTEHEYKVRAKNTMGDSAWSDTINASTLESIINVTSVPANINTTAALDSIIIAWDAVANATAYDIEVDNIIVELGDSVTYTHTSLEENTEHEYKIRAKSELGDSAWSETIRVSTLGSIIIPSVPENINSTATVNSIIITWDEVANATAYDIEVDGVLFNNSSSTSYSHEGLLENSVHTYKVRAKIGEEFGEWSPLVSFTTNASSGLLGVPIHVKAFPAINAVSVVWEDIIDATSYEIEIDRNSTETCASARYIHVGLESDTEHVYKVRAKNGDVVGEWSSEITVSTLTIDSNLALGKLYAKSSMPSNSYPDSISSESTDGILARDYSDGKSYGYPVIEGTPLNVDVIVDLHLINSVSHVRVHKWEGSGNYGADNVTVSLSADGITYTEVGTASEPDGIWYDFNFDSIEAQYIKVVYNKENVGLVCNWLFVDEIEVYGSETPETDPTTVTNIALEKTYTLSLAPSSNYPDSNSCESTDGELAGNFNDGKSYGYQVPKGAPLNIDAIIDLKTLSTVSNIRIHKWEGSGNYGANSVTVSLSTDGINYTEVGAANEPTGIWYDFNIGSTDAQYVKVTFSKENIGYNANWLFIDEIEVYGYFIRPDPDPEPEPGENIALGKTYTMSLEPSNNYPDTNLSESTDGKLAVNFNDSYGYEIPEGKSLNVDVIVDLQKLSTVSQIRVHRLEGSNNYRADSITVSLGIDGINYTEAGTVSQITGDWYDISFASTDALYVKVTFNKKNLGNGSDWLFVDEIEAYGCESPNPPPMTNINFAFGKKYTKSLEPSTSYPDSLASEFTDNIIAKGNLGDKGNFAYNIPQGESISLDITVDLQTIKTISQVKVHNWEGGFNYRPNSIEVYTSEDGEHFTLRGNPGSPDGNWYDIRFRRTNVKYVKVSFVKLNSGAFGDDWLFLDEIQVFDLGEDNDIPIAAPTNINYTATSYSNSLSWDSVPEATNYEIEINGTDIVTAESSNYIHNELTPSTQYQYRIRTNIEEGSSDWSSVITAKTAPAVLKGIRTSSTDKSIIIEWDTDANADGYIIEVDGVPIDNNINNIYTHSGLAADEEHNYRVRAKSGEAYGDWSAEIKVKTLVSMAVPSNIKYIARANQIAIYWDAVENATGYDIEVDGITIDNANSNSYVHDNLKANSTHNYRIRSKSIQNAGEWSSIITVQTVAGMLGRGTVYNPYIVINRAHLESISKNTKAYYKLGNDIDLENIEWIPIGTNNNKFKGSLDGAGYTIKNLLINKPTDGYKGLFGHVSGATLKGITLENVSINGKNNVGALVGLASPLANIQKCKVIGTGSIYGTSKVGGLIGEIKGNVVNCSSSIDVTGTLDSVGGLLGSASGVIANCYSTGNVLTEGANAGGIVGEGLLLVVSKSYASGNVTGNQYIGGIVGRIKGGVSLIDNCYASGVITASNASNSYAGGLLGDANGITTLSNSYSISTINAHGKNVGGLTGISKGNHAIVINCYFDSTVTGITTPSSQARTTGQMSKKSNYSRWDFKSIWNMQEGTPYPKLRVFE